MNKWEDYFNIREKDMEEDSFFTWPGYELVITSTDTVIGHYKDFKYAKKQAKFKFKKMMRSVERILLDG